MKTVFYLAVTVLFISSCATSKIETVNYDATPVKKPQAAIVLDKIETSGIFSYQDWKGQLEELVTSLALKYNLRLTTAASSDASMHLKVYLSEKGFVRGYQSLHALYAHLQLVTSEGKPLVSQIWSEETADTLESSHKLFSVLDSSLEKLNQSLVP